MFSTWPNFQLTSLAIPISFFSSFAIKRLLTLKTFKPNFVFYLLTYYTSKNWVKILRFALIIRKLEKKIWNIKDNASKDKNGCFCISRSDLNLKITPENNTGSLYRFLSLFGLDMFPHFGPQILNSQIKSLRSLTKKLTF